MRLPKDKVKKAILHPHDRIRRTAVGYFSNSYESDPTIMPLVIECVEKYGRKASFSILREAEDLTQTDATIDWLLEELSRDFDFEDVEDDNLCMAIALILCNSDITLLAKRYEEIVGHPNFPEELRENIDERFEMHSWDWDTGWKALEDLIRDAMERDGFDRRDRDREGNIVQALARCGQEHAEFVLRLLDGDYREVDSTLMDWMEPSVIDLAGFMHLTDAIPKLLDRIEEYDEVLTDRCIFALARIGGDEVVRAIADRWPNAGTDCRTTMGNVLEYVRTDLCTEKCLGFFRDEEDPDVLPLLAMALTENLEQDAVEPIYQRRSELDELTPEGFDSPLNLLEACVIMEVTFPGFEEMYADAVANNWGESDFGSWRIRETITGDWSDALKAMGVDTDVDWEDEGFDDEEYWDDSPYDEPHSADDAFGPGGPQPIRREDVRVGRNEPCPCGSGKKYKKCCLKKQ